MVSASTLRKPELLGPGHPISVENEPNALQCATYLSMCAMDPNLRNPTEEAILVIVLAPQERDKWQRLFWIKGVSELLFGENRCQKYPLVLGKSQETQWFPILYGERRNFKRIWRVGTRIQGADGNKSGFGIRESPIPADGEISIREPC